MANDTTASHTSLRKGDWIRFQIKQSKIVLEGFVQEISNDGAKLRIGKAPLSPENTWHALDGIAILKHQSR